MLHSMELKLFSFIWSKALLEWGRVCIVGLELIHGRILRILMLEHL
jgi:hypothetical protein